MLDKAFYQYILGKLNANTQSVTFKGNYVFVRINDDMTLKEATTYNSYDEEKVQYVAMAETLSTETPFVESNNRSGWTKQYAFRFPYAKKDTVLVALQEVRDTFFATDTHTVTDGSDTYKFVIKCQRPTFASASSPQAGEIYLTYTMQIYADSVETGYYGNEAKHYFNISTDTVSAGSFEVGNVYSILLVGTTDFTAIGASSNSVGVVFTATGAGSGTGNATELDSIIVDNVTISSSTSMDPSNDLSGTENTENIPTSRGMNFDMVIYYDSTTPLENILGRIEGKLSRDSEFIYARYFDGAYRGWTLYMLGGSVVYQKGAIIQLKAQFVEV